MFSITFSYLDLEWPCELDAQALLFCGFATPKLSPLPTLLEDVWIVSRLHVQCIFKSSKLTVFIFVTCSSCAPNWAIHYHCFGSFYKNICIWLLWGNCEDNKALWRLELSTSRLIYSSFALAFSPCISHLDFIYDAFTLQLLRWTRV
jgi:hypothetical protein